MKDLILLVADKNMEYALRGALSRPQSLGIRPIDFAFLTHFNRDAGVRIDGPSMLALERARFTHGVLVMDFEGSGASISALDLQSNLDETLHKIWEESAKAIVIEPELDVWMWGSDNALGNVLGRPNDTDIREWLQGCGFSFTAENKPTRPKEAMEDLLRELQLPRSSANYERIARAISLKSCTDPAFIRLREILQQWFPPAH